MKYWLLKGLPDEYNCVEFDMEDILSVSFDGTELSSPWKPRPVNFLYRSRKKGDYPCFHSIPFFSKKAIEVLKDLMGKNVEYLPVVGEASKFTIVNVIKLIDALDKQKSVLKTFDDGRIWGYRKIVLDSQKLPSEHIFKLIEFPRTSVIISDEFKKRVEETGLKGFDFEEVEVS